MCDQFRRIKDEFQRELDALNDSAKKCASENETLKSDICALKCRLDSSKTKTEAAENEVRKLCEQLEREKNNQRIEIEEVCKNIKNSDNQISNELHIGYESKLQKLLSDLRNQFKDKMCIAGVDIIPRIVGSQGKGSVSEWPGFDIDSTQAEKDLEIIVQKISEIQGKLANCSSKKYHYSIQVDRHQRQHNKNVDKIRRMQQELIALLNQYQDLIDIKLLLDFELAAYNQMLAIEEYRFSVTDMCDDEGPGSPSHSNKRKASNDGDSKNCKIVC